MTSVSSHLQGIMGNPVSNMEKTRRRVARLETRQGKDAGIADAQGAIEFDPNGLQYSNEAYTFEAPNSVYIKPVVSDFIAVNGADGFVFENIGAGAFSRGSDTFGGNYGVINVAQSGANTGSLARPNTGSIASQLIWDGFVFDCIFFCPNISSVNFIQAGFLDSVTSATPTDGVYMSYSNGSFDFLVYAAGVLQDSGSVTESWTHAWTKMHIMVQQGGDAICEVSTESGQGGSVSLDASSALGLTAIPMIKAYKTTAGSIDLAYFDYAACYSPYPIRW